MRISENVAEALLETGPKFLEAIVDAARLESGAQHVLIGSLRVAEADVMTVLALSAEHPGHGVASYNICTSPCRQVIDQKRVIFHLDNLGQSFPDDPSIAAAAFKAYAGFPFLNERGDAIGIMVLGWTNPLSAEAAERLRASLEPLLPRIEAELRQQLVAHAFEALLFAETDQPKDSNVLFRTIAQQAASLAQVHAAVLARCIDRDARQFRVLAASIDGSTLHEAEGSLVNYDGAPCHHLKSADTFFEGRNVQSLFPDASILVDLQAEAYCGFGFRDRTGMPLGHLAFIHNQPMSPRILKCRIVNIIANRAEQELQRHIAETERKALQEALVVRKKLESLGLLAGTIAHDFNNQLAAVIGHTELARLELDPSHPASPSLQIAEECMWRARDVVGDLMDFAGNTPRSPAEPVALNEVVGRAVETMGRELPPGVQLKTDFARALPEVMARPSQIRQLASNLVLNAADAIGNRGGTITLSTDVVTITAEGRKRCLTGQADRLPDDVVRLEIADNGPGMDPETAERVFDPYFSTKGVSRGLGLAGVQGVVRLMNAGLSFETQPGVGTRFSICFAPLPARGAQVSQADAVQGKGSGILVVEDSTDVRETLVRQLRSLGYRPTEANSGEQAVHTAKNLPKLDAVILDVVMPGMDGWETLDALRRDHPAVPALIISGYNQIETEHRPEARTGVSILGKPFSLNELRGSLDDLLARSIARGDDRSE